MNDLDKKQDAAWVRRLLEWYDTNKRILPWRSSPTPYFVWISEIMLQQTQVDTVIPYFERFVQRFPTVSELSGTDIEDVLKVWQGLGYYARARNLHKAAGVISDNHNGIFPESAVELQKLPGIGEYTAGAVASIAFGEAVPAVDGNCLRVFARFWGISDVIDEPKTKECIRSRLAGYVSEGNPSGFNQGIMELGALVCRPTNPDCGQCPIKSGCMAYEKSLTAVLPVRKPKSSVPHRTLFAAVVWRDDKVFVMRREYDEMLGGLWRFPNVTVKPGDETSESLGKIVEEQISFRARITGKYGQINHAYTHFKVSITVFRCEFNEGTAISSELRETLVNVAWISLEDVEEYPFDKASLKIIDLIRSVDFS